MYTFDEEGGLSVVSKASIQMNNKTQIHGAHSCGTLVGSESPSSNGELAAAAYAVVSTRISIPKSSFSADQTIPPVLAGLDGLIHRRYRHDLESFASATIYVCDCIQDGRDAPAEMGSKVL